MKEENITKILAGYLADTCFEDLPGEAVESTKAHILHTLGTIVAGSRAPGIQQVLNCVSQWGAKEESTILVYGTKLPAPSAALINGTMAQTYHLEMKDDRRSYPTGVAAIPAALAMAERLGQITGKELITAACLGIELGVRISLAVKPFQQVHAQGVGPLAAAASCSKLLRLDENGTYNAVAIAYRRAAVAGMLMGDPSLNETVVAGFPSQIGVQSALLAAEGFPLSGDVFQGPRNFFQGLYKEDGDLDALLSDLGKRYEILSAGPKPFPCHRGNHPCITGVLAILQKNVIEPEEIEEVRVYVDKRRMDAFEKEKSKRYRPPTLADMQHSIPYLLSITLLKGKLSMEDSVTEEALRDEKVLKFAERVKVLHDPKLELDRWPLVVKPQVVEISTRTGRVYSERVDYAKGDPKNPLTHDEYVTCFRELTKFSAKRLPAENIEKAIALIFALEDIQDVSSLCKLLA